MSDSGDGPRARQLVWATRSPGRVVARYADGRVLKGYARDFDPDHPRFRLLPAHGAPDQVVDVRLEDLKALFFVRSFEGDPDHEESKELYQARPAGTRKVRLEFEDGEILVGYATSGEARRFGVFVTPLDRSSNNRRVFAVSRALTRMERLL